MSKVSVGVATRPLDLARLRGLGIPVPARAQQGRSRTAMARARLRNAAWGLAVAGLTLGLLGFLCLWGTR